MTRVRIRGIYATAVTRLVLDADADLEVVQASPPIDARFDRSFEAAPADVTVEMSRDRQGIAISGDPEGVEAVQGILDALAIDTFVWPDVAAPGAVFAGTVIDTNGGGAIVSLDGDREGFLPFGNADDYVETGDDFRVQVHEPRAPWDRGRPVLDTDLVVPGDVLSLVSGVDSAVADTPDGRTDHELVRTTDLLSTAIPDDWGIAWHWAAADVSVATLDSALARAVDRLDALRSSLESAGDDGLLAAPQTTVWVWFGRASRFALDDLRRDVTETLPGHHRMKAGHEAASGAVDFAERLGAAPGQFPFAEVTDLFGPTEGDRVAIGHGKPDGRYLELGRGTVTDRDVEKGRITVERTMTGGGTYDALDVPRESGDVATTRFTEGRWWYPTVYRGEDGAVKGTYVNVSTPVELFPDAVRYVDLHVDVIKHPDGTVELVDEDELQASVDAGTVSPALQEKALDVATQLVAAFEDQ